MQYCPNFRTLENTHGPVWSWTPFCLKKPSYLKRVECLNSKNKTNICQSQSYSGNHWIPFLTTLDFEIKAYFFHWRLMGVFMRCCCFVAIVATICCCFIAALLPPFCCCFVTIVTTCYYYLQLLSYVYILYMYLNRSKSLWRRKYSALLLLLLFIYVIALLYRMTNTLSPSSALQKRICPSCRMYSQKKSAFSGYLKDHFL